MEIALPTHKVGPPEKMKRGKCIEDEHGYPIEMRER